MSLIFITGASRGYGQHLALAFGKFLQKPSKFVRVYHDNCSWKAVLRYCRPQVLSARDSTGLHDTAKQLNNVCADSVIKIIA